MGDQGTTTLGAPDRTNAVDVRDMGIRYDLRLTKRTTLKGSLAGMLRRSDARENHFWALRHINLTLKHGESLAVIGPNGAGKSTLLLALAGILEPSEGEIETNGRVSTLLTLGAGFEQDLTGRELVRGNRLGARLAVERDAVPVDVEARVGRCGVECGLERGLARENREGHRRRSVRRGNHRDEADRQDGDGKQTDKRTTRPRGTDAFSRYA